MENQACTQNVTTSTRPTTQLRPETSTMEAVTALEVAELATLSLEAIWRRPALLGATLSGLQAQVMLRLDLKTMPAHCCPACLGPHTTRDARWCSVGGYSPGLSRVLYSGLLFWPLRAH